MRTVAFRSIIILGELQAPRGDRQPSPHLSTSHFLLAFSICSELQEYIISLHKLLFFPPQWFYVLNDYSLTPIKTDMPTIM